MKFILSGSGAILFMGRLLVTIQKISHRLFPRLSNSILLCRCGLDNDETYIPSSKNSNRQINTIEKGYAA